MMSRFIKYTIMLICLACSGFTTLYADPAPDSERQAYLYNLLKQDCGSCHGLKLKGGLGTPLRPENLKDKPDKYLHHVIQNGIQGTPMPGWKALLSDKDTTWIIKLLREGAIKSE